MANGSVGIGKIFGISIELHWLFILLILFFFYLSPLLGLIWVLLFICVLIHELSHSITAIRNGIEVSKIILLPIGGASIINESRIDPAVEFNISIAGPIMSLLLGGIFGIAVLFTPPGPITYIIQYLFLINILLGVFNILPAFPMDGGRVLRSYLERRHGLYEATMTTVKVSKYCMALIIIGTLALFVFPNPYSFASRELILVWDLVIVFFLYQGAAAEEENVTTRRQTKGMTMADAVNKDYAIIGYNAKLSELYGLVKSKKEHLILSKTPQGDYALVDIFDKNAIKKASNVRDILISIPNLPASMALMDAMSKLDSNVYRVAAVVKGKKLIGIATASHISAFVTLHMMSKKGKALNN